MVGVYAPPSLTLKDLERLMDSLRDTVARYLPQQMLIMGDFNAKSTQWGTTKTNAKGKAMTDWAAGLDLWLLDSGNVSTCVAREIYRRSHVGLPCSCPAGGWMESLGKERNTKRSSIHSDRPP